MDHLSYRKPPTEGVMVTCPMTSRDPKCGNIGTLLGQLTKFINVKERTFYCKI